MLRVCKCQSVADALPALSGNLCSLKRRLVCNFKNESSKNEGDEPDENALVRHLGVVMDS